jgi:large subunit ribosomal protein L6
MSRLGKLPIQIPSGVSAFLEKDFFIVRGPKGELRERTHKSVKIAIEGAEIKISVSDPTEKGERSLWGLYWSLLNNMVIGVTAGYDKKLEINGVGYRAAVNGNKLVLNVGYSHQVEFDLPNGISAQVTGNVITLSGIDKQLIGETAAQIRRIRKPEPYKGKGIKYAEEIVRRKAGKSAGKGK